MNKVMLTGRVSRDVETRKTGSGISNTNFNIAVQRRFANSDGVREADFINIVTWRQLAEVCAKYLTKGMRVGVVGSIQTRTYEAQDGSKRYVTEVLADEVEFLESKGERSNDNEAPAPRAQAKPAAPKQAANEYVPVDDDDLPF